MKKVFRDNRGFTLVEAMVVVAVSSMIAYSMYAAMHVGETHRQTVALKMNLHDAAREGLYKMIQEIRQSAPDRIQINGPGNSIQFSVPDPGSLVDAAFDVNWASAHTIRYALGGNNNAQLLRTDTSTGQTSVIANDVSGVTFTGNAGNPTVVTISLAVQRALDNGTRIPQTPLTVTAQAEVRNV